MKKKSTEIVTLSEACEILKVHPNTLRLWDKKGVLKAIRFGVRGDRRYKQSDLDNLMKQAEENG